MSAEEFQPLIDENTQVVTEVSDVITYGADDLFPDEKPQEEAKQEEKTEGSPLILPSDDMTTIFAAQAPQFEHEQLMWNNIDSFAKEAWEAKHRGLVIPWHNMDQALFGLQTGFHVIGGDSNHGKSGFLSALECGLIDANPDVYILSYSLDDPFEDKLARVGAIMGGVTINFIKNPQRNNINQDPNDPWYIKWQNILNKLKNASSKMNISDSTLGTNIEYIEEQIKKTAATLDEISHRTGVEKKLVVTIDNFHDLTTSDEQANRGDENTKYEYLAQYVSDMATKYKVPVVCTAELRKLNGTRRPVIEDVRSASKIRYRAKDILLVYNEVSVKGEAASIYYTVQGQNGKRPVLEVAYSKNKYGSFKGRQYFLFQPETVKFVPANGENEAKWNAKIYG